MQHFLGFVPQIRVLRAPSRPARALRAVPVFDDERLRYRTDSSAPRPELPKEQPGRWDDNFMVMTLLR